MTIYWHNMIYKKWKILIHQDIDLWLYENSIILPCSSNSPLERGWRKAKEGTPAPPKVRLRQEVVSVNGQRRGQRIAVPVKKLFAREKRPYGLGMVGKLTNRTYRKRIDSYVKQQIEDMDDHRYCMRTEFSSNSSVRLLEMLIIWGGVFYFVSQAFLYILDNIRSHTHHHFGSVYLWHCTSRLLPARNRRFCECRYIFKRSSMFDTLFLFVTIWCLSTHLFLPPQRS